MVAILLLALAATPAAPEYSLAARAARFARVETAAATFDQEREVSLVEEVLRAHGTLALKAPDAMRLELQAPEAMTVVAQGAHIMVLDAQGKTVPGTADLDALGRFAHQLADLLFAGKSPGAFREQWSGADQVTLAATDRASPYSEIQLRFPSDGPLPERIVLVERGGDRTTIQLHAIRLNPPLDITVPAASSRDAAATSGAAATPAGGAR